MMISTSTLPDRGRTMRWPKMRPRFVVKVRCSAEQVMEVLEEIRADASLPVEAKFTAGHGVLTVPESERAFWSSHLNLSVEEAHADEGGPMAQARVLGIFAPHPEIWTAYVVIIGALITLGVFGVMVGAAQLAMGDTPWALLVPPIAALLGGLVYTTTLVGQGLALDEMYRLRSELDDCLARAEERARLAPATARDSAQL